MCITMNKNRIRLTESQLHRVVKESVKSVLKEGKPKDVQHGKHSFKGLRYDRSGNPIYTYDGNPNVETQELLKNQGWKMSPKHGMYGQISDPSKLYNESVLHGVIKESVKKVLRERVDFDNLSNTEITQQVCLEFNRALEDAHNAIEQECQELLSSEYWMDGADDGILLHQSYYDWVRDRLTDVISPALRNILPV